MCECVRVSVRWRALWEAAFGAEMWGRQAFLSFPEPSSRSLSVRSLILCSVEGLLPLFLPLSLTAKLFIAIVPSHTHKHTQACIVPHRRNQAEMAPDIVHFESPVHNLLTFSRDPFSAPNPSSLLSFLLLSLYCHGHQEREKKLHTYTLLTAVRFSVCFCYVFCYAPMLFIKL